MSETTDEGPEPRDREEPEVGLVADDELPEDLQPTEDNPLAQDPDETDGSGDADGSGGSGGSGDRASDQKVEGMPDMGDQGGP